MYEKIQYLKTNGARQYAGLFLSVCVTIVLSGWSGCTRSAKDTKHRPTMPHPSPITVADGSMVVRTPYANMKPVGTGEVDISGGQACSISVNGGAATSVIAKDWTITSSDNLAQVSTTSPGGTASHGATIYATGPNPQNLNSDPFNEGMGWEFGIERVQFSPAALTFPGVASSMPLDCGKRICKITIEYKPRCN